VIHISVYKTFVLSQLKLEMTIQGVKITPYLIGDSTYGCKYNWVVPLGTTSRNGQGTKFGQIIFLGSFFLNVFIIIIYFFSCSFIACQRIWLEVFIIIKKVKIVTKLYSLLMWPLQDSSS
jgi:hypothetical protein